MYFMKNLSKSKLMTSYGQRIVNIKQFFYLLKVLTIITSVCLFIVSCSKNDDINKHLSVDISELDFSQEEEKFFNILINDSEEWYFEANDLERYYGVNMANVKDFTIEPTWGKGKSKVSVKLRNKIYESYFVDLKIKIVGKNNHINVKLKANYNNE